MMQEGLRQICALSVFCGVLMNLTPSGGVKRIMAVLCSAALLCAILSNVQALDLGTYRLELARLREREASLQESGAALEERLNRLVIEEQLEAYILDKAAKLGLELPEVKLALSWSMEGFWVPNAVTIRYRGSEAARLALERSLEAELGIPAAEQEWSADD